MDQTYSCDLGATLHTSTRMWQHGAGGYDLLFAPDCLGPPVLVSRGVSEILAHFARGARVGDVLAHTVPAYDFDRIISTVGFLEERGFLKPLPDPATYEVPAESYQRTPLDMTVWLHITNECNLGCDYCFVRDKSLAGGDSYDLERTLARLVTTIHSNRLRKVTIKLAGGEPTLAPALMERVYDRLISSVDAAVTELHFAVLSNGTTTSARLIDFLHRPGVGIGISVDGCGADHDAHRFYKSDGRGTWDCVSRNIDQFLAVGIRPYIMATLTPESMQGARNLVRWLLAHDLTARLNVVRPYYDDHMPFAARRKSADQLAEHALRAFAAVFQAIAEWRTPVDLVNRLNICELSFNYPLSGPACGIGRSHVVINDRGMLADCVMRLEKAQTDIREDLLRDVRNTLPRPPYHPDNVQALRECLACRWFPVCGGGCPTYNARVKGSPFTQSPLCEFYKAVIPMYLQCVAGEQVRMARAGSGLWHSQQRE